MNKYANLEILKGKNSVCLISHISPDADALSSMIVLKEFLISHFNILNVDIFAEQTDNLETYRDIIQPHIINSTINKNVSKVYPFQI